MRPRSFQILEVRRKRKSRTLSRTVTAAQTRAQTAFLALGQAAIEQEESQCSVCVCCN